MGERPLSLGWPVITTAGSQAHKWYKKQGTCLFVFTVGSGEAVLSKRISRVSFYLLHLRLIAVFVYICDYFVLKVAVLIPFRNRHEHLPIFFLHLIPMLKTAAGICLLCH